MDLLEGILQLLGGFFGWLLGTFRRWLDRLPDRDPSQISQLQIAGVMFNHNSIYRVDLLLTLIRARA